MGDLEITGSTRVPIDGRPRKPESKNVVRNMNHLTADKEGTHSHEPFLSEAITILVTRPAFEMAVGSKKNIPGQVP